MTRWDYFFFGVVTGLALETGIILFPRLARGQASFSGEHGNRATQTAGSALTGTWDTFSYDPSTFNGVNTGSTFTFAMGGMDAANVLHTCPTNQNCSNITGVWTFSTGYPVLTSGAIVGDGSAATYGKTLYYDVDTAPDPRLGTNSAAPNWLFSYTGLAVANCADNSATCAAAASTGFEFFNVNTLAGSLLYDLTSLFTLKGSSATANTFAVTTTTAAATNLKARTSPQTVTANATNTQTFTGLIPAGCMLLGVTGKVTTTIGGCAGTLTIGTAGTECGTVASPAACQFASAVALASGTSWTNTNAGCTYQTNTGGGLRGFAAAGDLKITCSSGNFNASGAIDFGIHCLDLTAPTS